MVVEANQNPRGMLRRISTFARGVIRRPSSLQMLNETNNTMSAASPKSPSPNSPISVTTTEYLYITTPSVGTAKPELPIKIIEKIETVTDATEETKSPQNTEPTESSEPQEQITATDAESSEIYPAVPLWNQYQSANSDTASIGSMTLAPSSESLSTKDAVNTKTLIHQRSAASQKFLDEREARKATLRLGAQAFIQSKAESLQAQSPTFVSRPSIDRLRTITRRETETKPPVKSLISFWEQSTEPIEV